MAPDASAALEVRQKVQNFLNAACTGNLDLLKKIAAQLDDGKGLAKTVADIKDANKRGAIHFAAREGKTEVCRFLLEELKLDVDTGDEDGETPLLHAARQGHTLTAKYLLERGANPSIPSDLGATALHHSAGIGNIELLKHMLAMGVEVDSQSDAGTPLVWAAGHGQHDAVKVLLEHNANPNAETEDNVTPLLSAVAAGSLACLDLLIQAGAKVNITAGGTTPLHIAADHGNPELINSLLKAGADPNVTDEGGEKPIQEAMGTRDTTLPTRDLPEVAPEAKQKAAEAKSRGDEAFKRKDSQTAVDAYTQAIDFNPTDARLFSNRSLCWILLGQPEQAFSDAKACRALRPDWPKACYREANAFYEGVQLNPESKELVTAFREAVEAGRKFHGENKEKS
ncbi:putative WD-repeat protein [Hibiscus syriacus]|uniref:WD-repeat protein n=1 Tax=Hibiscus syriacus TaxID=106335 RepID=A0A6A3D1U5_HIBSY|nr:putative WD-repeat protein [Hibiscus syriacus]